MKVHDWSDILALVLILAIISLLVRPSSLGPALINASGAGLTALVEFAVT